MKQSNLSTIIVRLYKYRIDILNKYTLDAATCTQEMFWLKSTVQKKGTNEKKPSLLKRTKSELEKCCMPFWPELELVHKRHE